MNRRARPRFTSPQGPSGSAGRPRGGKPGNFNQRKDRRNGNGGNNEPFSHQSGNTNVQSRRTNPEFGRSGQQSLGGNQQSGGGSRLGEANRQFGRANQQPGRGDNRPPRRNRQFGRNDSRSGQGFGDSNRNRGSDVDRRGIRLHDRERLGFDHGPISQLNLLQNGSGIVPDLLTAVDVLAAANVIQAARDEITNTLQMQAPFADSATLMQLADSTILELGSSSLGVRGSTTDMYPRVPQNDAYFGHQGLFDSELEIRRQMAAERKAEALVSAAERELEEARKTKERKIEEARRQAEMELEEVKRATRIKVENARRETGGERPNFSSRSRGNMAEMELEQSRMEILEARRAVDKEWSELADRSRRLEAGTSFSRSPDRHHSAEQSMAASMGERGIVPMNLAPQFLDNPVIALLKAKFAQSAAALQNAPGTGPRVVFDMRNVHAMDRITSQRITTGLYILSKKNKAATRPLQLYFVNLPRESRMDRFLEGFDVVNWIAGQTNGDLDRRFSRDEVVYISPHASDTVLNLEPTKVYVFNANYLGDEGNGRESLKIAQDLGVATARLPILDVCGHNCTVEETVIPPAASALMLLQFLETKNWQSAVTLDYPGLRYHPFGSK